MANKKISDFTAATTLAGGDLLEIENAGGNSRKITATNAADSLRTLLTAPIGAGVRLNKTADQTADYRSAGVDITWDGTDYEDVSTLWDSGTPTRITVPAAYNGRRANVIMHIRIDNSTADTYKNFTLQHKDSGGTLKYLAGCSTELGLASGLYMQTALFGVPLVTGDYFYGNLVEESDTSQTVKGNVASHFTLQLCN